jgi:hypothetical protein
MARHICLPALCVALVALMAFFVAMEKQYRRTFYARDPRPAMHRRHWAEAAGRPTADEDRVSLASGNSVQYVADLASAWILDSAAKWEQDAAAWYTAEWRQSMRRKSHLMGPRATEALTAMRDDSQRTVLASLTI